MKKYLNVIRWEMILAFKEYSRYRWGLLSDLLVFSGTFIAIYFFGVSSGFESFYLTNAGAANILVLIGYIFWQNSSAALGYCTSSITHESIRGIFEIRLQSKYPLEGVLFCRLISSCLVHLVTYVGIILFCGFCVGYNMRDILIIFLSILVSYPAIVGMYGMGLILGSVAICEKKVGSLTMVVQTVLLFLSNTLSPNRSNWIVMIPFSPGIEIMRKMYLKQTITPDLVGCYILVNIFWLILGCAVFRKALRHEKEFGAFDNY